MYKAGDDGIPTQQDTAKAVKGNCTPSRKDIQKANTVNKVDCKEGSSAGGSLQDEHALTGGEGDAWREPDNLKGTSPPSTGSNLSEASPVHGETHI